VSPRAQLVIIARQHVMHAQRDVLANPSVRLSVCQVFYLNECTFVKRFPPSDRA